MTTRRSAMGVAVQGDLVYVIGGYDGIHSLNSVEVLVLVCMFICIHSSIYILLSIY